MNDHFLIWGWNPGWVERTPQPMVGFQWPKDEAKPCGKGRVGRPQKLDEGAVRAIRENPWGLTNNALARRYGVGKSSIARVLAGRSWTHVTPTEAP